jgi:hypothetical protein
MKQEVFEGKAANKWDFNERVQKLINDGYWIDALTFDYQWEHYTIVAHRI